jgi:alpha-L-rhamnosidase
LGAGSAAWADAATICPWQIYQFYGDPAILRKQFDCMKGHLAYIASATKDAYLWTGDEHFGDWLGIDAPAGSYKGASNEDLIASAFYAYSTELVIKAGKVLGEDVTQYEDLYQNIIRRFREVFPDYKTQTEMVLAAYFRLVENPQQVADQLADAVKNAGVQLKTGFVGTPYLLHVLSDYGHLDLAYALLLRTEYPSWLYPVTQGATTVWEHWDGKKPDGSFWSADMNSFNHYAYGAVVDWVYEKAAGIQVVEDAPGFAKVRIAPQPDKHLQWLEASVKTRCGDVRVYWHHVEDGVRYDIAVPVPAAICLKGVEKFVEPGNYVFYTRDER